MSLFAKPNDIHQSDLLSLPHDKFKKKTYKYALNIVDVASQYKFSSDLRQGSPHEYAKIGFLSITKYFQHIWPRNLADLVNFGNQTRKKFYQHEKLKLNAVLMRTISSEDIEKRHGVASEL